MKKYLHFFFLWLAVATVFSLNYAWSAPETSELTAKIEKSEVTIGEPVKVTVCGTLFASQKIQWPQAIDGLKGLSIVDSGFKEEFPWFGQKRFQGFFVLKSYEPGSFDIPPLAIKCSGPGNAEKNLTTQKVTITVKSLVQGDAEKLDVKDIKSAYNPLPRKILLLILAIMLSVAAWITYVTLKTKKFLEEATPPVPAHILALRKIKILENKDLISRGLVAEFYFELSMIVRQYLEARFSMRAPEMTTEEFLISLKTSQDLSSIHKQVLKEFLSHCDMVKFAKYGPQTEEVYASLGSAKKLIEETIPHDLP